MASGPAQPRHHTPGGWRRVLFGLLAGAGFGALVTRVVPPDRTWPPRPVWPPRGDRR